MLIDAHTHVADAQELLIRRQQHIDSGCCATDPDTAEQLCRLLTQTGDTRALAHMQAALHPWKARDYTFSQMRPYLEDVRVIGEIGLDSVWTDVPMALQRRAFMEQLELAQALDRPIVLHTKGMEREIAQTLEKFTMRKLIHWYSALEELPRYIAQDCYFSVGPDYKTNPAVQQVIAHVPLDRLLTETDGLGAVAWATGQPVTPEQTTQVLRGELAEIAARKGIPIETAERHIATNFHRFLREAQCASAHIRPT